MNTTTNKTASLLMAIQSAEWVANFENVQLSPSLIVPFSDLQQMAKFWLQGEQIIHALALVSAERGNDEPIDDSKHSVISHLLAELVEICPDPSKGD